MNYSNSFWNSPDVEKMYELDNAERRILHPYTVKLIHSLIPRTLLDYGCGDGYLAAILGSTVDISLFDRNQVSLRQLVQKPMLKNCKVINDESEIPESYFDCVVASQVLMCISSKEELMELAEKLKRYSKSDGHIIIVVTHPCFLQYKFGHWCTSYAIDQPFNYLLEGEPYSVFMKRVEDKPLEFTDFNWPISTLINVFLENGCKLVDMIELSDELYREEWDRNKYFPHYMYLIFK